MDDPYQRLVDIAQHLEAFESHQQVTNALDELEFIHEVLAPEHQDLANQLMERLSARRQSLSASKRRDAGI